MKSSALLVGFSGEIYHPLGLIDLKVTMGEPGRNKTILLEFAIVKCRSPYNVILGRMGIRSLGAESLKGMQADRRNAEFIERNTMVSAHKADVKDKRAGHIVEPKHSLPET
nr:reverse transcriptase domain-containing protein [Tanacetum cinerariifolium]